MRTTVDLPGDLVQAIKVRAARDSRRFEDLVIELLRRGLEQSATATDQHRVQFPLIEGGRPAVPGQELTPERIKDILFEQDIQHYFESVGETPPDPPYD